MPEQVQVRDQVRPRWSAAGRCCASGRCWPAAAAAAVAAAAAAGHGDSAVVGCEMRNVLSHVFQHHLLLCSSTDMLLGSPDLGLAPEPRPALQALGPPGLVLPLLLLLLRRRVPGRCRGRRRRRGRCGCGGRPDDGVGLDGGVRGGRGQEEEEAGPGGLVVVPVVGLAPVVDGDTRSIQRWAKKSKQTNKQKIS